MHVKPFLLLRSFQSLKRFLIHFGVAVGDKDNVRVPVFACLFNRSARFVQRAVKISPAAGEPARLARQGGRAPAAGLASLEPRVP